MRWRRFDSFAYQLLLAAPRFNTAVDLHCVGAHAEPYRHVAPPLDVTTLQWLGERETWLDSGVFERHANEVSIDRCETLLAQYLASCFHSSDQSEYGAVSESAIGMVPPEIELSDQFDNWLQRQAALALYDRFGIAPFAENLCRLRQELLQYLAVTGRIDAGERERLLEAFRQHGTRGDGNFFSVHHWLIEGDLLQSLT